MKLLHLDSSILGEHSVSRQLTAEIVARWQAAIPGLQVRHRDLDGDAAVVHLSSRSLAAADELEQARSEQVLQEFLDADVVVLGAPMYNFGIPSSLKAWIDRIAVKGRTFRYTAEGPEGLARGKRIVVAASAGGEHGGQPSDFVEPYLRHLFGFLGVEDVGFVRADGVNLSPEHRAQAIDRALATLSAPVREAA